MNEYRGQWKGAVMRRNSDERRMYAIRRLSRAVDRQITSAGEAKQRAAFWAKVWGVRAGFSGASSNICTGKKGHGH
ncbi:hypothetical protein AFE_2490 [Acidithiobacillus ferrooxidans ATCC 23270]|uniref:Uncharacterized protein n=1 Tax=Acidithiobacillus ferrooxidans (strain ATCC 23270 / DSM 14882 / CIP 104768 / NCIMB 8455) TaxID=243159 RepID=B7J725_ACIF2|nr:hypothetical protein AFE_2490 [Acidithiobacillus ferrooxidans ATCC 23270]